MDFLASPWRGDGYAPAESYWWKAIRRWKEALSFVLSHTLIPSINCRHFPQLSNPALVANPRDQIPPLKANRQPPCVFSLIAVCILGDVGPSTKVWQERPSKKGDNECGRCETVSRSHTETPAYLCARTHAYTATRRHCKAQGCTLTHWLRHVSRPADGETICVSF